jgi:tRNA A37 threonylcarbamoyladenosine biosynthesis protein TsaE
VDASQAVVEGVLLQNTKTGKQAVTLMNWGYQGDTLVPQDNLTITINGLGKATLAKSVALGKTFPVQRNGAIATVKLDHLDEGDVLLFE